MDEFIRATFFRDNREETDEERQAACAESTGECLPEAMGVFRFYDEGGIIARDAEEVKRTEGEIKALSDRIQKSKGLERFFLRRRRRWIERSLESMRAKQIQLVIRHMGVTDYVMEERGNSIEDLSNDELSSAREKLRGAQKVDIAVCQGRLRALRRELVA